MPGICICVRQSFYLCNGFAISSGFIKIDESRSNPFNLRKREKTRFYFLSNKCRNRIRPKIMEMPIDSKSRISSLSRSRRIPISVCCVSDIGYIQCIGFRFNWSKLNIPLVERQKKMIYLFYRLLVPMLVGRLRRAHHISDITTDLSQCVSNAIMNNETNDNIFIFIHINNLSAKNCCSLSWPLNDVNKV